MCLDVLHANALLFGSQFPPIRGSQDAGMHANVEGRRHPAKTAPALYSVSFSSFNDRNARFTKSSTPFSMTLSSKLNSG